MSETATPNPLDGRRLPFGIILAGILIMGAFTFGTAGGQGTIHTWTQVAVVNFTCIPGGCILNGLSTLVFNSTYKGSLGPTAGLNFTIPSPGWSLPFVFPQGGFGSICCFMTGQITVSVGSLNSTDSVIAQIGTCFSTTRVPPLASPQGVNDDCPTSSRVTRFGPSEPLRELNSKGTKFQSLDTLPLNAYIEVGNCQTGLCFVPGTQVFVYLTIQCGAIFISAFGISDSCSFWGKGSGLPWDLGNMTIIGGKFQVFA